MQGAFLCSPLIPCGGRFIESVREKGHDTGDKVERKDDTREATGEDCDDDKCQKANSENQRKATATGWGRWHGLFTDERNRSSLGAAFTIDFEFVSDEFASCRPTLAIGKGADMQKDALPATLGRNEPEAFIIFPRSDTTLVAYG